MSLVDRWGCLGSTIKVSSGHYVDIQSPEPDMIDIQSIASALSKICRFGGHCPLFYSVAEHCIHAAGFAYTDGHPLEVVAAVLLHDATEAYLGDMVKPLKQLLPEYSKLEGKMELAVSDHFRIDFRKHRDVIKHYDRLMLKAEKIAQWPEDNSQWEGWLEIEARPVQFKYYMPEQARIAFLEIARSLDIPA